ncbi:MAG TPA: hypothetical protein VGM25_16725 [Caulobacteraceae bacterium]|jgi:hypothetical protein
MSFSASHQDTSNSSTDTLDPQYSNAVYGNLDRATALANTPFQPYAGQQVAGFTPDQTQAQAAYAGIGQGGVGSAPLQAGINLATGVGQYQPQAVTAAPLTSVDLSGYMNPYSQQVIDSTLSDLNRQRNIQATNDASTATQAGAFGGSRSAVLQGLDDDNFARQAAQTAASLNQQNFSQAQAAAQGDLSRQLSASQANQNAGLQGAGLTLNAANALSGMGGQQLSQALQQAGALSTAGDAQQQNQQAQLNAAYQQWQLAQQYPLTMQNVLDQAVQLVPKTGTTNSTGSATKEGMDANLVSGTPFAFV